MTRLQANDESINGLSSQFRIDMGEKLRDATRAQPVGRAWTTSTQWVSGFKTRTTARSHSVYADETADFFSDDSAPTAHEYILAALGSCIAAGMVLQTSLRHISLEHLRIDVTGSFDNIVRAAEDLPPAAESGYFTLRVNGDIVADAGEGVLHDLWNRVVDASPVVNTLLRPTPVIAGLVVNPSE